MPVKAPRKADAVSESGAFLCDGKRLYCVVDSAHGHIKLEDCRYPDENPVWHPVGEVLTHDWRVVKPSD